MKNLGTTLLFLQVKTFLRYTPANVQTVSLENVSLSTGHVLMISNYTFEAILLLEPLIEDCCSGCIHEHAYACQ